MTKHNETDYTKVKQIPQMAEEIEVDVDISERTPKKKLVKTKAKQQKKGLVERMVLGLIGPDGIAQITSYLGKEIVVPAVKNIVVDSITSGINMAMFGGEARQNQQNYGGNHRQHWNSPTTRTNYSQSYRANPAPVQPHRQAPVAAKGGMLESYILDTRDEATMVLDSLCRDIAEYGYVTVADYYDLIGVATKYTDNNYGWNDLSSAKVLPARNGWQVKLPIPNPVDYFQ